MGSNKIGPSCRVTFKSLFPQVRTDKQVTIHHSVTFRGVCRFNSVVIESQLINSIHIQELANLINANYLISLGDRLDAALHAARSTREVLAGLYGSVLVCV